MTSDYDQAMFFIGACHEGSGIHASDTLNNANFTPRPALGALLRWFRTHGGDSQSVSSFSPGRSGRRGLMQPKGYAHSPSSTTSGYTPGAGALKGQR
jgi:hypothetical protein